MISIESEKYKKFQKAYKYAQDMTKRETNQAVEGMFHNLNTLQSRSGNQLPFSSINTGTCTLPEGRLITKALLDVSIEGLGKFGRTSIFPCMIFQCMKGVNREPGDPNYDLFRLALKSTAQRIYPNYCNCDTTMNDLSVDRKIKQEVLDELSGKERKSLADILKSNSKVCEMTRLSVDESDNIIVDNRWYPDEIYSTMGCRTVNGSDINFKEYYKNAIRDIIEGKDLYLDLRSALQKDGRGNICPVTIILPTIAMKAIEKCNETAETDGIPDNDKLISVFMDILETKIEEAKDSLIERFNWICKQSPDSAKFMYENNTMAGYIPEEGIVSALKHGTLTIGLLGINEAVHALIGSDHYVGKGKEVTDEIIDLYTWKCKEYKEKYKLNFAVYYTPAENLCHTALKNFRKKYGVIPGVSDKEYFTNSIHVPVWKEMDPFEKIDIESRWANKGNGGTITYVELPSTTKHNIDALETLVNYAMDKDIPYFAVNLPLDCCEDCGYQDEIGEKCPKCGSQNITRLRRVTGYLTGNYTTAFNKGKVQETEQRVKHIKH